MMQGDLAGAAAQFGEVVAEAEAAHDVIWRCNGLAVQGHVLAYQGDTSAARAAAEAAIEAAAELGGIVRGLRLRGVGCRGPGRRGCCGGGTMRARRPGST